VELYSTTKERDDSEKKERPPCPTGTTYCMA